MRGKCFLGKFRKKKWSRKEQWW